MEKFESRLTKGERVIIEKLNKILNDYDPTSSPIFGDDICSFKISDNKTNVSFYCWVKKDEDGQMILHLGESIEGGSMEENPLKKAFLKSLPEKIEDFMAILEEAETKPTPSMIEEVDFDNIDTLSEDEEIDEYGNYDKEWIIAEEVSNRNVFVYKDFMDTLTKYVKTPKAVDEIKNEIVLRFLTLGPSEIDSWLNSKHGVPVRCKNKKLFYRKRSPKGSNINSLNRFLVCKGSQVNRDGIDKDDIVLLTYLGPDMHEKSEYQEYADFITEMLEDSDKNDFERVDKVKKAGNFGIVYKASVSKEKHKVEFVPMLDDYQSTILNNTLLLHPPCVVYGSAGTGKTLLSEELYAGLIERHPEHDVLYLTYMPRLKNQVIADLKKRNVKNIDAQDIRSFVVSNISALKKHPGNYKTDSDFKDWVKQNIDKKQYKLSNIDSDEDVAVNIAYIFFRTYSFTPAMNSESDFMEAVKKEGGIEEKAKKLIFKICSDYQKNLKNSGYYSDNNAANELKQITSKKQYDAIIVDEIQDLTKLQVESLLSFLKDDKHQFYAFGDDNQSINPTLLRLSEADQIIHENYNQRRGEIVSLSDSYRSTDYLIRYINYINRIRSNVIGRDKNYNEQNQRSKISAITGNESDKPAYIIDENSISEGLKEKSILENNDIMIIVPNKKEYEALKKKYPQLYVNEDNRNIMTIEETKGGEWDTVILYNFISSAPEVWKQFADLYEDPKASSLRSTIHRMYFNRFYVGLTRAAKKVIIAETSDLDETVKKYFLPDKIKEDNNTISIFSKINNAAEFGSFFANDYTYDVWRDKAENKFEIQDYEMAYDFISKAVRALASSSDSQNEAIRSEYDSISEKYQFRLEVSRQTIISKEMADVYLDYSFKYEDLNSVKEIYSKSNQEIKLPLINISEAYNPEAYISKYKELEKKYRFSGSEKEYYLLKTIKAYKSLIDKEMKG